MCLCKPIGIVSVIYEERIVKIVFNPESIQSSELCKEQVRHIVLSSSNAIAVSQLCSKTAVRLRCVSVSCYINPSRYKAQVIQDSRAHQRLSGYLRKVLTSKNLRPSEQSSFELKWLQVKVTDDMRVKLVIVIGGRPHVTVTFKCRCSSWVGNLATCHVEPSFCARCRDWHCRKLKPISVENSHGAVWLQMKLISKDKTIRLWLWNCNQSQEFDQESRYLEQIFYLTLTA